MGAMIGGWLDHLRGRRKIQAETPRRIEVVAACPQCRVAMRWQLNGFPVMVFVTCAVCGYGWSPEVRLIG